MKGLWLYIGSAVSVTGLVLGLSLSSAKGASLSAAGSSTVFPLMAIMAQTYPEANINVSAGGSGLGIQQVSEDRIDIGNASKYPDYTKDVIPSEDGWKNLKTFTMAEDALAMVTKLPSDCSINGNQLQAEWTDLYKAYSVKNSMTYADLFKNTVQGSGCSATLTTLTRQNPSTSGTAEIFINYLAAFGDPKTSTSPGGDKTPLQNSDNANISTNEANAITLSQLQEIKSGITYLSYGFYSDNTMDEKGIYPVAMKFNNQFVLPTDDSVKVSGTYNWVRPLNSIINLSNTDSYNFISWWLKGITDNSADGQDNIQHKILKASGYYISSDPTKLAQFSAQLERYVDENDHSKGYKGDLALKQFGVLVGDPTINKNTFIIP